ncbi:MAG: MFS transporter [Vicinamibacteria bacterium]
MLLFDGACTQVMGALTGGAFLVAFALLLGASNTTIGLLAAIGPLSQLAQIPTVFLVERTGLRKPFNVLGSLASRLFWIVIALAPWGVAEPYRIPLFLASLILYFAFAAVSNCAYSSWMRDFIPERIRGAYLAKRTTLSTSAAALFGLAAAFGIEFYKRQTGGEEGAYTILFLAGAAFGLVGTLFLAQISEPRMAPRGSGSTLSDLRQPFRDEQFRTLLLFLAAWNFAANLAAPFFAVYMIKRLGLGMTLIIALSLVSQSANVFFLGVWGRLADRLSNKSVLAVSGPLFMISVVLWPLTAMSGSLWVTIPLLVLIHTLAGASTAGVTLCTGNIAVLAAPRGRATAYLATNAIVSGLAALVAPLVGGLGADWLAEQELRWTFRGEPGPAPFSSAELRGLDFLFIISFVIGLYAIHRLFAVKEEGEVEERIVLGELYAEVGRALRHVSNVAGIRHLTHFPYGRFIRSKRDRSGPQMKIETPPDSE